MSEQQKTCAVTSGEFRYGVRCGCLVPRGVPCWLPERAEREPVPINEKWTALAEMSGGRWWVRKDRKGEFEFEFKTFGAFPKGELR